MSDTEALKTERTELINKMAEMQKQFMDIEHDKGVSGKDYWGSKDGLLADYRDIYAEMSTRLVDVSHEIVGSSRHF